MKNSYRFFENRDCQYFPCHKGLEDFNCMFCYCPFYLSEKCPGNPVFVSRGNNEIIKDCTDCNFPHRPESYDVIIRWIMHENKHRTFSEEIRKKNRSFKKGGCISNRHVRSRCIKSGYIKSRYIRTRTLEGMLRYLFTPQADFCKIFR